MSIKTQFEDKVEALVAIKDLPSLEDRNKQVEDLTEWYFEMTGKHYDNSHFLDLLASYILADTIRDRSTHKVKKAEYPILSTSQQKLRNRRESRVGDDNLDFIKLKEIHNHPDTFKVRTVNRKE
jgi:hypothetical protein